MSDVNEQLTKIRAEISTWTKEHKIAQRFAKWNKAEFIYQVGEQDLREYAKTYHQVALKADKESNAQLNLLQKNLKKFLEKDNQKSEVRTLMLQLLEKLNFDTTELQEFFDENAVFFTAPLKAINTYQDFQDFVNSLSRLEYALRLTLSSAQRLTTILLNCIEEYASVYGKNDDDLVLLKNQLATISAAQLIIQAAVEKYEDKSLEVKKHIYAGRELIWNKANASFQMAMIKIELKLQELTDKAKKNRCYIEAGKTAEELLTKLDELQKDFFAEKIGIEKFKDGCNKAIEAARPVLKNHRGWAEVFTDISFVIVSIVSCGIANIVSKMVNNSFRFFDIPKTDSEVKIDEFNSRVQAIAVSC